MLSHSSPTSDKVGDGGVQPTLLPKKPLAFLHIRSGNSPDYTMEKGLTQTQGKSQAWITIKILLQLQLPSACNLANTRGGERLLAVTSIGEKKQ